MPDQVANLVGGSHHAGLQFIWAVSFGQLLAISVALLSAFAFVVKLGATQRAITTKLGDIDKKVNDTSENLTGRVNVIAQHVSRVEVETMQDRRELQRSINELNNTLLHIQIAASPKTAPRKPRATRRRIEKDGA